MAILSPFGPFRALDNNGDPLSGGKLYTYEAGTSTPKATYTDAGGLTANANPVVLNSAGYANVWLGDGGYKFILQTAAGATLWTIDDIGGDSTNAFGGSFTDNAGSLSVSTVYQNGVIRQTGAGTLSLLPAATAGSGFYFIVRKDTASTVTIDPNLSETINGASTLSLVSDAVIICNGTAWYTLFMQSITAAGTNTFTGTNTFSGTTTLTGAVTINGTSAAQASIAMAEDTDNGTNKVTIRPPATLAADYTLTLPADDGTTGQALTTDGSGTLAWSDLTTAATQANQETATSTTTYVSPGRQQYHPSACKAWVNFNGTGTVAIRASYNVSSITDNGTGDYTVNLTVAMSSANYCVTHSATQTSATAVPGVGSRVGTLAAGSFVIKTGGDGTSSSTLVDAEQVMASVFGDQ